MFQDVCVDKLFKVSIVKEIWWRQNFSSVVEHSITSKLRPYVENGLVSV